MDDDKDIKAFLSNGHVAPASDALFLRIQQAAFAQPQEKVIIHAVNDNQNLWMKTVGAITIAVIGFWLGAMPVIQHQEIATADRRNEYLKGAFFGVDTLDDILM